MSEPETEKPIPLAGSEKIHLDRTLRQRWHRDVGTDLWQTQIPEGWGQGRSTFGGYSAALAVALSRKTVGEKRHLRHFSTQMLRPIVAGPIFGLCLKIKEGKSVVAVETRLIQNDEVCLTMQISFTTQREASLKVEAEKAFDGPGPDGIEGLPYIENVTPEFVQNVDMRWVDGGWPFSGQTEKSFRGYCRFRINAGDDEGLTALLDVFPSPAITMMDTFSPASTVTWSGHLICVPADFSEFFSFEYDTVVGVDGFHTIKGRLWAPAPDSTWRLCAWSEQLVALFD
jgi:acyl-CoA thioesterase